LIQQAQFIRILAMLALLQSMHCSTPAAAAAAAAAASQYKQSHAQLSWLLVLMRQKWLLPVSTAACHWLRAAC
jgi:hypothetical protein